MACSCKYSLSNTGAPNCTPIQGVIKKLIIVPLKASDGSDNYIDLSATLDEAYFSDLINEADKSKRWYPTPEMKNVTSEKAESIFEEFEDGSRDFIKDGVRSFLGLMPKQSPQLLAQLQNWRCAKFGVFIVDNNRAIIGAEREEGKLFPIVVENASWNPVLMFGTDTSIQKIQLGFNFDVDEQDGDLRMIEYAEISPVNPLSFEGLLDVNNVVSNISTTGFDVKYTTIYGSALEKEPVEGLLLADFSLFNVTDNLSVAITSVTEILAGKYTLVFPAQTSGDSLRLSVSKDGYDFKVASALVP